MREAIEFLARESRKAPKREDRYVLATFGLMLGLFDRFERRGFAIDVRTARLVAERLDQARLEGRYWIEGVRVPSIIRTYQAV
jgi:hypothetical protein